MDAATPQFYGRSVYSHAVLRRDFNLTNPQLYGFAVRLLPRGRNLNQKLIQIGLFTVPQLREIQYDILKDLCCPVFPEQHFLYHAPDHILTVNQGDLQFSALFNAGRIVNPA